MKKKVFGRRLSRDTNERKALFRELMNALVLRESITTTEAKARAIRGKIEKLVTKAKQKDQKARPFVQPYLSSQAVEKLIKDIAPRFKNRPGGYVRIVKLNERFSDNAAMAMIEWVEKKVTEEHPEKSQKSSAKQRTEKEAEVNKNEIIEAEIVAEKETKVKKQQRKPKKEKNNL
ncbi:MAG TPA: 50S ribosomal protein L17 [Patescibacteria group bacterium]|nr:50S ribosomal protein L17 [Patescibacteria group bacterium]